MWLFVLSLYTLKRVVAKIGRKNENKSRIGVNCFSPYTVRHLFIFFIPVGYQQVNFVP